VLEFLGTHVAGKMLDWAVQQGVFVFAGSEQEQATRQVFEEATIGALVEVCDEAALSSNEESVRALAEHLASALSEPSVAAVLLRAANTNGVVETHALVERMKCLEFDAEIVPFEMEAFLAALVPRLRKGIDREVRHKGLTETVITDRLDELLVPYVRGRA
jgi:hypothetical protein